MMRPESTQASCCGKIEVNYFALAAQQNLFNRRFMISFDILHTPTEYIGRRLTFIVCTHRPKLV